MAHTLAPVERYDERLAGWIDETTRWPTSRVRWDGRRLTLWLVDWRPVVVLAHVLAAFWFVAGYVGTNALTEIARRAQTHEARVGALVLSDQFDRWLYQKGGTAVLVTGVLSWWFFGHSLTTPWILASIALIMGIALLTVFYWRDYGQRVNAAIGDGDAAAAQAILTEPRAVVLSRVENVAIIGIIVLMVLRPG